MTNWQQITLNLRSNYKSLSAIGREVGSDWQHMNRLSRGEVSEPKYSVGIKLLNLHFEHCNKSHLEMKL